MAAIGECCAGLDVPQATVVAGLNSGLPTQRSRHEVRTFGTTRPEWGQMRDWLLASGGTRVAMASPGIDWRAVSGERENHVALTVGHAQPIKNGPAARAMGRTARGSAISPATGGSPDALCRRARCVIGAI